MCTMISARVNHAVKQSITVHKRSRKAERFNVFLNQEISSKWLVSIKYRVTQKDAYPYFVR